MQPLKFLYHISTPGETPLHHHEYWMHAEEIAFPRFPLPVAISGAGKYDNNNDAIRKQERTLELVSSQSTPTFASTHI